MHLKTLKLKDFRCFSDKNVSFKPGINVIYGLNAVGKTSLLEAINYLVLTKNLIDYSFPIIMEESSFICGEEVKMNVLSNCDSIKVTDPNGNVSYLDVSTEVTSFKTSLVGTYVISMNFNGDVKEFNIYSNIPTEESNTEYEITDINLEGELGNEYSDGIYDKLIIFFIILAIVYVADWVVYCREQYQLR